MKEFNNYQIENMKYLLIFGGIQVLFCAQNEGKIIFWNSNVLAIQRKNLLLQKKVFSRNIKKFNQC